MIGSLKGKIISKKPTKIMVEVNGVGYLINISLNTFEKIADKNDVTLYTYLSVKQDRLDLYGFYSISEKEMFELLINVSGIGPKSAQSILSGIQIEDLKDALKNGNIARILSVPGIGRKTAERLMIELRDKVDSVIDSASAVSGGTYDLRNDAVAALVNLGYNQKVADRAVRTAADGKQGMSIEELVKVALTNLNK